MRRYAAVWFHFFSWRGTKNKPFSYAIYHHSLLPTKLQKTAPSRCDWMVLTFVFSSLILFYNFYALGKREERMIWSTWPLCYFSFFFLPVLRQRCDVVFHAQFWPFWGKLLLWYVWEFPRKKIKNLFFMKLK